MLLGMIRYQQLEAWGTAHRLVLEVYRLTESWPQREWYGLVAQTRRAAASVPLNIAEGSAKRGPLEFRRFLDISLGSLAELHYALRLALDLGYLTPDDWASVMALRDETSKVTWGLYRVVSARCTIQRPRAP